MPTISAYFDNSSRNSCIDCVFVRGKTNPNVAPVCYGTKWLVAPMKYNGYTNTEVFLTWVGHFLCKELNQNQIVIMDNSSFHKSSKVKEFIENVGCTMMYCVPE
jgi:hypothetical protein